MSFAAPTFKRCPEIRAHYAHEWFNPLRIHCPGGPAEDERPAPTTGAKEAER